MNVSAKEVDIYKWQPIDFLFPASITEQALNQLASQNDTALADVEAYAPGFQQKFPAAVSLFAEMAFRSIQGPMDIATASESSDADRVDGVSYVIAKHIKNLSIFALGEAVNQTATGYDDRSKNIPYNYCVLHPESEYCSTYEYNSLNWGITRRVMSSAAFVTAMCPVIKPFTLWNLNWNTLSEGSYYNYGLFFDELERVLTFVYGNGEWSTNRLDSINTTLTYGLFDFIIRRYLDGGPELIQATLDCVATIRSDFENQSYSPDPSSSGKIDGILNFNSVKMPDLNKVINLQKKPLNDEDMFRLSYHYTADQALPSPMYKPPAPGEDYTNEYGIYLNTLIDWHHLYGSRLDRLTYHLNQMDPNYSYRSIRRDEFLSLLKMGELGSDFEDFCIIEGSESTGDLKSYVGASNGTLIDSEDYSCDLNHARIVRETKN